MVNWLTSNLSTILVSALLIMIVFAISYGLIKQKKKGKSSCGCSCSRCAMHGQCHK